MGVTVLLVHFMFIDHLYFPIYSPYLIKAYLLSLGCHPALCCWPHHPSDVETKSGPWQLLHPLPDRPGGPIGHRLPGSLLPLHLTGLEPWSLNHFPFLQLNSPPASLVAPILLNFLMVITVVFRKEESAIKSDLCNDKETTPYTWVRSHCLNMCIQSGSFSSLSYRSYCRWVCTNFIRYCWLCSTHLSSSWISLTSSEECAATFQYSRKTFCGHISGIFYVWVGCTTQY